MSRRVPPPPRSVTEPALPTLPAQRDALLHCAETVKRSKTSFYWAMRMTPEPRRSAMWTLYAFMRACDDAADDHVSPSQAIQRVSALETAVDALERGDSELAPQTPPDVAEVYPAMQWMLEAFDVDVEQFRRMLQGQRMDILGLNVGTYEILRDYCTCVASSVGQICLEIWGYREPEVARKLAQDRGVALQLTNILRDIREDAALGRCYLPAEDLERFGVTTQDLALGEWSDRIGRLMSFEIERTRSVFEMSAGLERRVHPSGRLTCAVLAQTYRSLLNRIAAKPRAALAGRVRMGRYDKARCVAAGWWSVRNLPAWDTATTQA